MSPAVWNSNKQTIVGTSSAESEYIALYDCMKQVSWIRKLFWELVHCNLSQVESFMYVPTVVNIDSSAAQALAMNRQASARTKHIDLKHHFVKDALQKRLVVLRNVASAESSADMLKKVLDFKSLRHLTRKIGHPTTDHGIKTSAIQVPLNSIALLCVAICAFIYVLLAFYRTSTIWTHFSLLFFLDILCHLTSPAAFVDVLLLSLQLPC